MEIPNSEFFDTIQVKKLDTYLKCQHNAVNKIMVLCVCFIF